ncbi:MAG TPA: serine/threonine-protein kinase [Isosphaeraceae bacterium]|jgi:serine/threonine-protein kinase|nr:serine/threonine-protein kinase [Isosphaeraceae bacterium]
MGEPQATRFWHAALQSGLIDEAALQRCWDAVPVAKRTPDAIDRRLARQTVNAGHLSLWQAQRILSGRSLGFRIDKYILLDRIGQGGMGQVYLAKDTRLNRQVALKVLSPERMNNPRALARFQREAKVGAQLQHENLVRIYDEGDCNGIRYLVMEFIEGQNAGRLVAEKGPMPPATAARLVRQVALGLAHAHQKGLIHRDVNPWNILVTYEGAAKLTDVGLAIDLFDQEDAVTRDGATVGTFDYISPEQARHSRSVDARSDIYSLGCTLFHLVTGRVPFPMPSLPEKLYAHQTTEADLMSTLVDGLPPGLDDVVRKMMKKKPDDRYSDPSEVARALEPFVDEVGQSSGSALLKSPLGAVTASSTAAPASTQRSVPTVTVTASQGISPPPDPAADSQISPFPESPADAELRSLMPALDFGPDLPLSDSMSGVKAKYRPAETDDNKHLLRWGAVAAGVFVLALALGLTVRGCSGAGTARQSITAGTGSEESSKPWQPSTRPGGAQDNSAQPITEAADISVRYSDGTERSFATGNAYEDLHEAIRTATGNGRGEIILRNRKPLILRITHSLTSSGGHLMIRAGKNQTPILFVVITGGEPFLMARSDSSESSLTIEGLTIQATYEGDGPATPLIMAAGNLKLDHCSFSTAGSKRETIAVSAEGLKTTVSDCWFQGFDKSIWLEAFADSHGLVRQCMLIQDEAGGHPAGWAITVRRGSSVGSAGERGDRDKARHIEIEHCTASGAGLMELEDFVAESPVYLDVRDTVVRAQALLEWKSHEASIGKPLHWSGRGNRYDIGGAAWVMLPPSGPNTIADAVKDSPTDLESWLKLVQDETGSKVESIKFIGEGTATPDRREPKDYAVAGDATASAGADPDRVGPVHRASSAKP